MAKVVTLKQTLKEEEEKEEKENISIAIEESEEAIKKNTLAEKAYDRLMILYRKEKNYKKNLE